MTKGIVETYTKASPVLEMEQSSEPLESNQPNSWACSKFPLSCHQSATLRRPTIPGYQPWQQS